MSNRNANDCSGARQAGRCIAAGLLLLLAGGCVTVGQDVEDFTVSRAQAQRDLGIDYLSSRRTAMAIRELTASLEADPTDPQTHLWLGEAYRRKGQVEKARVTFETALELARGRRDTQTEQDAQLNLSALLSQMGRHEEALVHCEALAAEPTFASPWRPLTNCGWALIQLGRYDDARQRLDQALEFFPRYGPALLNLGILEAKQGRNLVAITAFQRAIASGRLGGSGRTEANFRLGEIFVALGEREKAITHFRAAVETGPMLEWGSQSQAYLDLLN
jgi:Tfp pilus assembly protein PilF